MEDTHATDTSGRNVLSPKGRHAAPRTDPSPFGVNELPADRTLRYALYGVGAAVVLALALLGWMYWRNTTLKTTQSESARAVANLTAIVKQNPKSAQARVKLAEALAANGQIDDSIAQLKAALQIEPENASAMTDLGIIAMQRKEWTKAEGYWKDLVTILNKSEMADKDQRLADVYYYLGTCYVELTRYEDAVANLKQSIAIKRDSSPVHYMLSVAYARLHYPEMQKQELQIVVAFDPKEAQANYDLGKLALAAGDKAQAAEYFRIAVDNAPTGVTDPADALRALGNAADHLATAERLKARDPKQALYEARIAAALDPTSTEAVKLVATLADQLKDTQRALNAWQRYLELVPGDPTATDAIKRLSANGQ